VGAKELYDYFKLRASQYGIEEYVRLNHRVTAAHWSDESGKWIIDVADQENARTFQDEAEIFINGAGFLK
jgi:cation diffusion facilitator CzcD-associated flavoprotein CzcO